MSGGAASLLGRVALSAAKLPFKAVAGGISAYGKTTAHMLGSAKPMGKALGIGMVAAPAAALGSAAVKFDSPNRGHVNDYGDMLAQNTMTGAMPVEQMSSYDMNRSLQASRDSGLMKLNGWRDDCYADLEKTAFLAALGGMAARALPSLTRFGAAAGSTMKNIAFGAAKNSKPSGVLMGAGFTGMLAAPEWKGMAKTRNQNISTAMNEINSTPRL